MRCAFGTSWTFHDFCNHFLFFLHLFLLVSFSPFFCVHIVFACCPNVSFGFAL